MCIGIILRRQQQGRRAIDDARRIAGMVEMLDFKVGVAAVDLLPESEATAHVEVGEAGKARLERGETLGGRFGPREFLAVERDRSEEHTSELQSLMRISYAVFCLKKKINT